MRLGSIAAGVALAVVPGAADADVLQDAPSPCVNRLPGQVRYIHDTAIDAKRMQFCTGADCWTLARTTNTVDTAPPVKAEAAPDRDPMGTLTDGKGTVLATAGATRVEFCPPGRACRTFKIAIKTPGFAVWPAMNAAGTLGAVMYHGAAEPDDPSYGPSYVLAFDLVAGRRLGILDGSDLVPLDHGFILDSARIYNGALKRVGKLAAHDEVWIKVGSSTDLIAVRDETTGEVALQNTRTAKVTARIPLGADDKMTFFKLVSSPDGAMVYAIGMLGAEGDVVVIDVARGKLVTHASPVVCAKGTMRRDRP